MASITPTITSWLGYKISEVSAEIVITGYDFGDVRGSVKLNVQGGGRINAFVKSWSDKAISVVAPVDSSVQRVHVYVVDARGKEKQSVQSPPSETRNTSGAAAPWSVTSSEDNADVIVIEGTNLDEVQTVHLYDSALLPNIINASFVLDGSNIEVDWPAAYTSPITKLRLSDDGGNHVTELVGGSAGWEAAPNGIINDVVPQPLGEYAIINVFGNGFGSVEGDVLLREVGGSLDEVPILTGGWTDSLVQVVAQPGITYDLVELIRADGETALVGAEVPQTFTTPSGAPAITSVAGGSLSLTVGGSGFLSSTFLNMYRGETIYQYELSTLLDQYPGSILTDNTITVVDVDVDELQPVVKVQVLTATAASNLVVAPELGGPWSMDSLVTFTVSVDTGTNRINIVASKQFFGVGANPPFATELTVDGQLYTMAPGPLSGYWTEDDSTHAHIKDASAWGNVVTDIDFFSTGVALVFLAGWDGSVPTT